MCSEGFVISEDVGYSSFVVRGGGFEMFFGLVFIWLFFSWFVFFFVLEVFGFECGFLFESVFCRWELV